MPLPPLDSLSQQCMDGPTFQQQKGKQRAWERVSGTGPRSEPAVLQNGWNLCVTIVATHMPMGDEYVQKKSFKSLPIDIGIAF